MKRTNEKGNIFNNVPSSAISIKRPEAVKKEIVSNRQCITELPRRDFIGGPSQPEMSSFKPVGTSNMVNLFTGDFSYNIPLMDVGGYPVNIFYDGSISMEQEASWVGLGWNINPGTVSRNMRGVPDDFNGEDIMVQRQEMKPNKTWGVTLNADLELVGIKNFLGFSVGSSLGISFNNYLGPALDLGLKGGTSFSIAGKAGSEKTAVKMGVGLGANVSSRSGLTLSPNVSLTASSFANVKGLTAGLSLGTSYNSRTGIKQLQLSEQMSYNYSTAKKIGENDQKEAIYKSGNGSIGASLAATTISFAKPSYVPTLRMPLNNEAYSGHFQLGGAIWGIYGSAEVEVYSQKSSVAAATQNKPLVGYLYYQKANNNPNAVMDFTRLNDNEVSSNTPVISVPQYTYDVFTIQGEGVGGSIRAYRNDMGYVRDNITRSKDNSLSLGVDVGIPGHIGANFNTIKTPTVIGEWGYGNLLSKTMGFREASGTFENVYFRNPGETSVLQDNQWEKIGGTDLVRFRLGGTNANPTIEPVLERFSRSNTPAGVVQLTSIANPDYRKKRTQVTSFLTAEEAALIGLDKNIKSYNGTTVLNGNNVLLYDVYPRVDAAGYRKKHHISQISVTEPGGKRYVYGIPVYNVTQKDFSFTVTNTGSEEDKVNFSTGEPTTLNNGTGKDGYLQITETPAYAHSFLLTGLLAADYVDVAGDGITEDDLGDAVKFNYTKFGDHAWRTPHTSGTTPVANFNSGNRTETKDDKGMISYGKRESWYLHSIESKTMIALFTVEDRNDGKGPISEYAGVSSSDNSLKRLKKIDLFNKADLKKNGVANAKPVKTVWFAYSYTLCSGTPDNTSGGGKLTLDSIYFTFNGKTRVNKSKYAFAYTNGGGAGNPAYAFNSSDRWGSYKPKSQNPGGMKNSDYPYSVQDKTTADGNAGAWALKKVLLPSGGQLEVEYESDDYAFVQNKRAAGMMEIVGLGSDSLTITNKLYGVNATAGGIAENDYVFIKVPVPCASKNEVFKRYISGMDQLAFKISVNMPKGAEFVNSYASVTDYGVYDATRIWVRVNRVDGFTPLTMTALQYLRERLPGQAFPGYDVAESSGLKQVGEMLLGMLDALKSAFKDPVQYLRSQGKAQTINVANSFVRLNDPDGIKYGGGQRVRSVKLKDNWQAMTGQYTAEYGQVYDYTTTEVFNGAERTISSGVASYEPSIGGEENPFQSIVQVSNKLPMGPASYGAIEMPVLDAFFPAAIVGYSKVTVKSIRKNADTTKRSRSGIGKQVTNFYTAKDYPVYYNNTSIDPATDKQDHQASLTGFFYKYAFDSRALSQGFIIETNDMHGKMKSQASYAENDEKTPVNYTENFYRNTGSRGLNEKFDFVFASQGGVVQEGNMGIDVELMTDTREFSVKSTSLEVQAQVDLFPVIFPFWLPFIWPVSGESENTYRAVTTTKVISYHSVLDSVVVIEKGSQASTKNLVFDAETGDIVISRVNNEFDKPEYSVKYPAWWAYSGMGLAYKNIDAVFTGIDFYDGKMINGSAFEQAVIESGDELYILNQGSGTAGCYPPSGTVTKLWAYDKNKNSTSLTVPVKDLMYLDEKGKLFTKNGVGFRIVRSGKRNILDAQVASMTMNADPVAVSGGTRKLTVNSSGKVTKAGAVEYREKWQIDNEAVKKLSLSYNINTCAYVEGVNCNGYLEKSINPYLKGIVGNYRAYRNLVFYSDLTETNPTAATNISENGFYSNFQPYWNFNAGNNLVPDVTSTKWLWKVQATRYNIKGMEIETKDPLNIYTAAQYGYHRTLPTAITSNSRYDESVYEGFEDYNYNEALNNVTNNTCAQKHITFAGITNTQLVNTDTTTFGAHTGKYVLGVKANTTVTKQFAVKGAVPDSFKLAFQPDTVNLGGWVSVNKVNTMYRYCGTTFKDSVQDFTGGPSFYIKYDFPFSYNGSNPCGTSAPSPTIAVHFFLIPDTSGTYTFTNTMATPGGGQTRLRVRANPTIGALNYSNFMTFPLLSSDREFSTVADNRTFACPNNTIWENQITNWTYFMCAGKPYEFVFYYTPNPNSWPMCNTGWPYFQSQLSTINIQGKTLHQEVKQVDNFCYVTKPIAATDTMFNPVFSIPLNRKMLLSAWVREACPTCDSYTSNQIKLQFNASGSQVITLRPAGAVIEGWQRYEGEFTAPAGSTQMTMSLVNSSSSMVWFDDIRIHPFSANMKTYTYDPVNLRLVAEMDANNYATYYEYDEEGDLVRTKAETREGIKTINETRSFKQRNIKQVQ